MLASAGVVLAVLAGAVLALHPGAANYLAQVWDRQAAKLAASPAAEPLFFVGAAFLALPALRRRRWGRAAGWFTAAFAWLAFYRSVAGFLGGLGADSFAEARAFDLDEARFWLTTLRDVVRPIWSWRSFVVYAAASLAAFAGIGALLEHARMGGEARDKVRRALGLASMAAAVLLTIGQPVLLYLSNSADFARVRANFASRPPRMELPRAPMGALVYIGESTSALHMGLYGYRRDTTPRLSALARTDSGLLVFRNVFSTHTHTSLSLLEALSAGLDPSQNFLPINERKRLSVVDALGAAGYRVSLVSNQGRTGTWNEANAIIFANGDSSTFSTNSRLAGNSDALMPRPWDDAFFAQQMPRSALAGADDRAVVFFHSYAGHGPYLDHVPASFRQPVDDALRHKPAYAFTDADAALIETEAYDSTLRYIDHAVAQAIEFVKLRERPTLFVYFSDHGEIPGVGHDSARFSYEMALVPFLVYFNEAARREHAVLYEKYVQQARQSRKVVSTLAELPATLFDLLDVRPSSSAQPALALAPVIGDDAIKPPIVVRRTVSGVSFVDVNRVARPAPARPGQTLVDNTSAAARAYVADVYGESASR